MGLPLPLATCLSWVGPPSNLGGGSARAVFLLVSQSLFTRDKGREPGARNFACGANYLAPGWFKFCLRRKLPAPGTKGLGGSRASILEGTCERRVPPPHGTGF